MDDSGNNVIFSEPAPISSVAIISRERDRPIDFMDHNGGVGDRFSGCERISANSVLGAAYAQWCEDVVKSGEFRPITGVEAVGLLLTKEEAAGVGVRFLGHAEA